MAEKPKLDLKPPSPPTFKILTEKVEYPLWSARMKAYLSMHHLWQDSKPADSNTCFSLLTCSVSDAIFEQCNLLGHTDAPKVWDFLKTLFVTSDLSSKSTSLNNLLSFHYHGKDMNENKTALLMLKRDLKCSFEDSNSISMDDLVTLIALVNLPTQYHSLRTTLEETTTEKKPLSLDSLFVSLTREESAQISSTARAATPAKSPLSSNFKKCTHNRLISKCWTCTPSSKPAECQACKSKGFSKILHPPNSSICRLQHLEDKNNQSSSANRMVRFTVDSGSTDTLVSNKQDVQLYSSISHPIRTANGEYMHATDFGCIKGSTFNLDKVLVCPKVTENLLSVSKLDDQGLDTLFSSGKVYIGKSGSLGEILSTGNRVNSSYYFDFPLNSDSEARTTISEIHKRFNHLNSSDLQKLSKNEMVTGLNPVPNEKISCESCLLGKMKKGTPPQHSSSRATRPGELFHSDICGPFESSLFGNRYLLSFTDDYSRYVFVFLIQTKSDVFPKFKFLDDYIYNKTARHISTIRSDNAQEFKSASFVEYCAVYGISKQYTTTYSSNQNGVAERLYLTLFDGVRTLLIDSKLPLTLWDEAAMSMAYTRNRSPTSANSLVTPYELFHGTKPDVSHLKTFGSTCFALTTPYQRRITKSFKLTERSEKCSFMGYSNDSKSYRLLTARNQIILRRYEDTIFTSEATTNITGTIQNRSQAPNTSPAELSIPAQPTSTSNTPYCTLDTIGLSTNITGTIQNRSQSSITPPAVSSIPTQATPSNSTSIEESNYTDNDNSFHTADINSSDSDTEPSSELASSPVPDSISPQLLRTNQPGIYQHRTKGKVSLQPITENAPKAIDAPPQLSKRYHPPVDYSQSLATTTTTSTEEALMCNTTDCINHSGLEWYKLPPAFARSAAGDILPTTYESIESLADKDQWLKATNSEIASLIEHKCWELVPLPPGRKALKNKWVFRIKRDADGNITRYKARLCACGYSQKAGIDYKDIFSPVVRSESFRLFLGIVAGRDMECIQMDVVTAFLNGSLKEEVYMRQPPGYITKDCPDKVCKITKNLYGLKQAPKVWHDTIDPFLKSIGFQSLNADPCLYFKRNDGNLSLISLYVDDLAIASDSADEITEIKEKLMKKFQMTDDGEIDYILGMEIRRDRSKREIYISSRNKIDEILKDFNMSTCFPASTPMDCVTVSAADCPSPNSEEWNHMQNVPYRSCVGKLTHLF
jgi:transposase InsO family protein